MSLRQNLRLTRIAGAVVALLAFGAHAQSWVNQAGIDAITTASDNADQGPAGDERKDLLLTVTPHVDLWRHGPELDLRLHAQADLITYARGSQPDRFLPSGQGSLNATITPQWLYLEGSLDARQVPTDPFGPRADDTRTSDLGTATSVRLSPVLRHDFSERWSVLLREDESLATGASGPNVDLRSHDTLLRIDARPMPIGFGLELSRLDSNSSDTPDSDLTIDAARARASVALGGEWIAGVVGGAEHTSLSDTSDTSRIGGLTLVWAPSQRTQLTTDVEHRFFGTGGSLSFTHRMPWMSLTLQADRGPLTATSALGPNADLSSYLDAILTTRNPDPIMRASMVGNLLASGGLQNALPSAVDVLAGYAQLQTRAQAAIVFLGTRNTLTLSGYALTLRQHALTDSTPLTASSIDSDNRQAGGRVEFNRRLAPEWALDASAGWSTTRGLAALAGNETTESTGRLALVDTLSPHTGLTLGLRFTRTTGNVASVLPYRELAAFGGISHRF